MYLGQIFVKNAKMTPENFLDDPNWTEIENRKNAEILVNSVKIGFFWSFKTAKLSRFPRKLPEIYYTYSSASAFTLVLRFCENSDFFGKI